LAILIQTAGFPANGKTSLSAGHPEADKSFLPVANHQ
jgi:hypothetical protein